MHKLQQNIYEKKKIDTQWELLQQYIVDVFEEL
jgi:hypothetical protein